MPAADGHDSESRLSLHEGVDLTELDAQQVVPQPNPGVHEAEASQLNPDLESVKTVVGSEDVSIIRSRDANLPAWLVMGLTAWKKKDCHRTPERLSTSRGKDLFPINGRSLIAGFWRKAPHYGCSQRRSSGHHHPPEWS